MKENSFERASLVEKCMSEVSSSLMLNQQHSGQKSMQDSWGHDLKEIRKNKKQSQNLLKSGRNGGVLASVLHSQRYIFLLMQ